jgi:hypothetical protein
MQVLVSKVQPKSEMKQFVITLGKLKYIFFYLICGLKEETERLRWLYPESVNGEKRIYKIITVKE